MELVQFMLRYMDQVFNCFYATGESNWFESVRGVILFPANVRCCEDAELILDSRVFFFFLT